MITSGGIERDRRVHITNPRDWGMGCGTDYWANFGDLTLAPGDSSDLDLYGWSEAGTWTHMKGSTADFLASADVGLPGGAHFDTAGDSITSPCIFGDYAHALMVEGFLGYTPTTLNMECFAWFAANNDEEATGFGFVEAGATAPYAKGDLMALVTSDGTNFSLESGAAAAAGSTDNTIPHLFKIEVTAGAAIKWYIDGTLQANTLALQTDLWPVAWVAATATGGANDPIVSWVHIWYS